MIGVLSTYLAVAGQADTKRAAFVADGAAFFTGRRESAFRAHEDADLR